MRMPNGERAVVDLRKLSGYCLNDGHPKGRHKARVFESVLGISATDAQRLRKALLDAAQTEDADPKLSDENGQRYQVDFSMRGPTGQATVRSAWIVRAKEDFPRLVTCYILE